MRAEQQQMPSASEIDERKARMRKAVFGQSAGSQQLMTDQVASGDGIGQKSDFNWKNNKESATTYSEADVARIVSARRKRSEAVVPALINTGSQSKMDDFQARFRERQAETVTRLNHGQTRTRYEHEVCSTRDAYAALLVTQSKSLLLTPLLAAALQKVGFRESANKIKVIESAQTPTSRLSKPTRRGNLLMVDSNVTLICWHQGLQRRGERRFLMFSMERLKNVERHVSCIVLP